MLNAIFICLNQMVTFYTLTGKYNLTAGQLWLTGHTFDIPDLDFYILLLKCQPNSLTLNRYSIHRGINVRNT